MAVNFTRERPAPPPLELQMPRCPLCGFEVDADPDHFWCEGCGAFWSRKDAGGVDGEWDEPDAKRCTATDEYGGEQMRCVQTQGHRDHWHTSPFRGVMRSWRTGVAR